MHKSRVIPQDKLTLLSIYVNILLNMGVVFNRPEAVIIFPALNEASRVGHHGESPGDTFRRTLDEYQNHFGDNSIGYDTQLVVVNDGSTDDTREVVLSRGIDLIDQPDSNNHGKGSAIRLGMLSILDSSSADNIGSISFTDADGAYSPQTLQQLIEAVMNGSDIAVARRIENTSTNLWRHFGHIATRKMISLLASTGVDDPQAGAIAFNPEHAGTLWGSTHIDGYAATTEVLHMANKLCLNAAQLDAVIRDAADSRINPLSDGLRLVNDSIRIKLFSLTN